MSQIIVAIVLIALGILSRTIFHVGPNFELVTASAIVAGLVIKNKKLAMIVPLATMLISDSMIGNTNIFLFTWSAYALTPVLGALVAKFRKAGVVKKTLLLEGAGLASVLVFFLWTNLGVVLTTNMYEKSFNGLIASYINALPFLKPQVLSLVFGLPFVYAVASILNIRIQLKGNTKESANLKLM